MSRANAKQNLYYQRLSFLFRHAAAFMPLIMVPFGLVVRAQFVDGRFYSGDIVFAGITAIYTAVSVIYFYLLHKNKKLHPAATLAFAVIFHLLTFAFVLFVSGFLSAFLAVWIVLMISSDLHFGTRGFIASFVALCVAALFSVVVHPEIPTGERIEIFQGTLVVGAIGFVIARIRGITDREKTALAKTRQQEIYQRERLLALVNSMGDAVVACDEQGVIKVYNATMLSLLDTNANLSGKPIDEILRLHDSDGNRVNIIAGAQESNKVLTRTDLSYKFSDGEVMKLYVNVAPIRPSYQSHAERGYILILRDITKEKSLEEERDEFISVVSHELRTPIAIAEGNLSNIMLLAQKEGISPQIITRAAQSAHTQILYLAKLINDLGTLSRAERGVGGNKEEIDLTELIRSIFATYEPQAAAKKLHLNMNIAAPLPKIKSSRLYLQEILQNLLTNAIKYTKEGYITVRAGRMPKGLVVSVIDTGIGISKSDQKHIFEKFYRSEDYRTRESSGTGLGLYLCKKLAEKLGADLTFTSRLNHGSTFTLLIPKQAIISAKNAGGGASPQTEPESPDSKRSVPSS